MKFLELTSDHSIINSGYLNYLRNFPFIKDYKPAFEASYDNIMTATENFQEKHMLQDMVTYLPDDILTKVDRASMAFSLETRVPFIDDHRLVEFSFDLPHHMKYRNHQKKYILKQLLYKYLPRELVDRPKMGFGVPIYDWLRTDLKHLVDQYLSVDYLTNQVLFKEKEIGTLRNRFLKQNESSLKSKVIADLTKDGFVDRTIWHLIVFQLWYERFFKS
jgi:asparagine synthase (glutamine-hydrolysing)